MYVRTEDRVWAENLILDPDGRDEYDLRVGGALTYTFTEMEVPLLGEVAATISADVQQGFRGEAL